MAGEGGIDLNRNLEAELALHVGNVLRSKDDRDFDGNGDRIGNEHEALDLVVAAFVMGDGLEYQLSDTTGVVALGLDLDRVEVENSFALRGPLATVAGILKEVVWAILDHIGEVVGYWVE